MYGWRRADACCMSWYLVDRIASRAGGVEDMRAGGLTSLHRHVGWAVTCYFLVFSPFTPAAGFRDRLHM